MYSLDHLQMFVETVETGSFSACARKLGKVQSAVSQGIANLEIDLGVELFNRSTRKPSLSSEGERLLPFAKSVLAQADELSAVSRAIEAKEESQLNLAVDTALMTPQLGRILYEFSQQFPSTLLHITEIASADIPALITSHQADVGVRFCDTILTGAMEQTYVGNIPFIAVCASAHPLAQLKRVEIKDLIPEHQLMPNGHCGEALDQTPPISSKIWRLNSFHTTKDLAQAGLGWCYLPLHMAEQALSDGRLHHLPVSFDHKPWHPPVEMVFQKKGTKGPALNWLAEALPRLCEP